MARILITSGPTRQYLDPVRYLTNASSGQMGAALAASAVELGHDVLVISGPVDIQYPAQVQLINVITTDELLQACQENFPECDGMIGAAAPCDYRPVHVSSDKIKKTGQPLLMELVETSDVVASMGEIKRPHQWLVGFALETNDARFRALMKLEKKCCDLVVVNGPQAIESGENSVEVIDPQGHVILQSSGDKSQVARELLELINQRFVA